MPVKYKDIVRLDYTNEGSHGWLVRVRFKGELKSKSFSDGRTPDKDVSLEAAIAWRNKVEKDFGKVRSDKHQMTAYRNNTGVVGVRFHEKQNRYIVTWTTPEGKQGKTSVSVRKYGKEAAFIKACTLRQQKELERLES